MFKHILLASDGSETSRHAALVAVQLAQVHGAKLTAVFMVDPYPYLGLGQTNPLGFPGYMAQAHDHAAQVHAEIEALCRAQAPGLNLQLRLVEDVAPADGIVQTAQDQGADLIVIGSHGRSGLARLMLGSVANKVVAQSLVPVMVTR